MTSQHSLAKFSKLSITIMLAAALVAATLTILRASARQAEAAPIQPPEGYPKLQLSDMMVNPTLAGVGGETLVYRIELMNTGAYTASSTSLANPIPPNVSYNNDAQVSDGSSPTFSSGELSWVGDIGFDATVVISYSVTVAPTFSGTIQNQAVITQALVSNPLTLTASTLVTDDPVLTISKYSEPATPGADKPLTYTLRVVNEGQPAVNLPITVTDQVPANTSFLSVGPDGLVSGDNLTWTRMVSLGLGESSDFYFTVQVNDIPSGTVLTNQNYQVWGENLAPSVGTPISTTVVDPEFLLSKQVWPDPPGSNREMTYTLTLLNRGSLATDLTISDQVPSGVTYLRGGDSFANGEVTWNLASLDTDDTAEFSFTVYVGDVADIEILNSSFQVCSAEGICQDGRPLSSFAQGPNFEVHAAVDPIAKKPGGGNAPVTPTLTVSNLGPGNAIDARALLQFERISVGEANDLIAIPSQGSFSDGPDCGEKCVAYYWNGNIDAGTTLTFTTSEGQNTIGGEEGTRYTATISITDTLATGPTEPITATASGKVTHLANLIPTKSAPGVIGRGLPMTYTISIWNSGQTTDTPPFPTLREALPPSTTLLSISDGGVSTTVTDTTIISWTLPSMSTGEEIFRYFSVLVDDDLISGTQIINQDYRTSWYEQEITSVLSNTGVAVTSTVREVGLIDSYKVVTPTLALPGPGTILTHHVHIVNSSPVQLNNVSLVDTLPWQNSTYQRDAIASAGQVISDIVSINWLGNLAPFSQEIITFTVLVDPDYEGAITNTATITHSSLLENHEFQSVAYITALPVLKISKLATPDPVRVGNDLLYEIKVQNLGQTATDLMITDTIPENTTYKPGSASDGGQLVTDQLEWQFAVLGSGEERILRFLVTVNGGDVITNQDYQVSSFEGVSAVGLPVMTSVTRDKGPFIPMIYK